MCVFIKFEVSSVINYFEVTPKIPLPSLSAVTARPEPFLLMNTFLLHEHVTNTRSASLSDLVFAQHAVLQHNNVNQREDGEWSHL